MRIPLSWLSDYIDLTEPVEGVADRLTSLGLEVEACIQERPSFSGVVVAKVLSVSPHPNADALCIAVVDDGSSHQSIVCGAPNCRAGLTVAFATLGAKLGLSADGGAAITISQACIRGVASAGMLCSEDELGFADESTGIVELPDTLPLGADLANLFSDTVIEVAVTPNLGHCLSMLGVARELAASYGIPVRAPYAVPGLPDRPYGWTVEVKDSRACPLYSALVVEGPFPEMAPLDVRLRLRRAGIRSQGFVVDYANYVMVSVGQPMHTFDARAFAERRIVVEASGGESAQLLDGKDHVLPEGVLTISNGREPCALAGVMGSAASAVSSQTQTIVVEAALFDAKAVRRGGRAVGVFSEAMRRFERGVDPNGVVTALQLFWQLVSEQCPTASLQGAFVEGARETPYKAVTCRRSKTMSVLGRSVSANDIENVFSRLQYAFHWVDGDTLSVLVPPYRHDVSEEIDLIEDIAKYTGFAAMDQAKVRIVPTHMPDHGLYLCEQKSKNLLVSLGLQEFITCDLISPALASLVADQPVPRHAIISVTNPVSLDQSVLRPSLFPGLIDCFTRNVAYGQRSLAAFEIGSVYFRSEGRYTERLVAGVLLSGKRAPDHFSSEGVECDFFDIKGVVEGLAYSLDIPRVDERASSLALFHDGRQAVVLCGGQQVGMLGEIHPRVLDQLGIDQRVYFMEIDLQDLFAHREPTVAVQPLALFPSVDRDWTLTVPESLTFHELLTTVHDQSPSIVERVSLRSIFRHERLGSDTKNVTLRFVFREPTRTLTQKEVDEAFAAIVQGVSRYLGVPPVAQVLAH